MNKRLLLLVRILVLGAGLILPAGCSSFHRDWKSSVAGDYPHDGLAGPWDGEWRSDANGHHGRLRCLARPSTNGHWEARFHATYKVWKFIPLTFGYTVNLEVDQINMLYDFRGEEDLGKLAGGVYRYEGVAGNGKFYSSYQCQYDHGVFNMQRPVLPETD